MFRIKPVVCCASKSILTMLLIAGCIAGGVFAVIWVAALFPETEPAVRSEPKTWHAILTLSIFGLWIVVGLCVMFFERCKLAVESNRKPWYWIPGPWQNRLPKREMIKCSSCGNKKDEPYTDWLRKAMS